MYFSFTLDKSSPLRSVTVSLRIEPVPWYEASQVLSTIMATQTLSLPAYIHYGFSNYICMGTQSPVPLNSTWHEQYAFHEANKRRIELMLRKSVVSRSSRRSSKSSGQHTVMKRPKCNQSLVRRLVHIKTTVSVNSAEFCDVTICILLWIFHGFGRNCLLLLQGKILITQIFNLMLPF